MSETGPEPLISVCVPTYRYGHWLGGCLESVLSQSLGDFELIVLDDASDDNTAQVVESYRDARLRFSQNERRLGMVGNWNKALQAGRGRYLAMLHGDDFYLPGLLEKAVAALEAHPTAGFVFSAYQIVNEHGQLLEQIRPWSESGRVRGSVAFDKLLRYNPVRCPTVVVRRAVYEKLGWFDPQLLFVTDWEMWLRILSHYDVVYLNEILAAYRLHPTSTTENLARQAGTFAKDERRMFYKVLGSAARSKQLRRALRYAARRGLGRRLRLLRAGQRELFRAETRQAIHQEPLWGWRFASWLSLALTPLVKDKT